MRQIIQPEVHEEYASPAYLVELLQESDYNLLTFLDGIATSAG